MALFQLENRKYYVDEESLNCFRVDDLAYKGLELWIGSGHTMTLKELETQLLTESYDEVSVAECIKELSRVISASRPLPKESDKLQQICGIELHVANACNLGCKYCFAGQGDYGLETSLMTAQTAQRSLDYLVNSSSEDEGLRVVFFGGEPLLNLDVIEKTIEYANEKYPNRKFSYSTTTNGTLLSDKFIQMAAQYKIHTLVSMDGSAEIQDKLRPFRDGRGTSKTIREGVRRASITIPLSVRSTITRINTDLFSETNQFINMGFSKVFFSPVSTEDPETKIELEDLETIKSELLLLANDYLERAVSHQPQVFRAFSDIMTLLMRATKTKIGCGAGRRFVSILPNGDIYPCHRFAGMGNYRIGSIFNSDSFGTFSRYWNETVDKRSDCKTCWIRNYCGGGCYWEAANPDGTISSVRDKKLCDYRRILFEISVDLLYRLSEIEMDSNELKVVNNG